MEQREWDADRQGPEPHLYYGDLNPCCIRFWMDKKDTWIEKRHQCHQFPDRLQCPTCGNEMQRQVEPEYTWAYWTQDRMHDRVKREREERRLRREKLEQRKLRQLNKRP